MAAIRARWSNAMLPAMLTTAPARLLAAEANAPSRSWGPLHRHRMKLQPQHLGGDLDLAQLLSVARVREIAEDGHQGQVRHRLLQELQRLAEDVSSLQGQSRDVPSRPREAGHEPVANRSVATTMTMGIDTVAFRARGWPVRRRDDDVDLETHELGREARQAIQLPLGGSRLEGDVLPLDPTRARAGPVETRRPGDCRLRGRRETGSRSARLSRSARRRGRAP